MMATELTPIFALLIQASSNVAAHQSSRYDVEQQPESAEPDLEFNALEEAWAELD